jgi:hypothetical protein
VIVGEQEAFFIAPRVGVHKKPGVVSILQQRRRTSCGPVCIVDRSVAVDVVGNAVAVVVDPRRPDDVALPEAETVGVGGDPPTTFASTGVSTDETIDGIPPADSSFSGQDRRVGL